MPCRFLLCADSADLFQIFHSQPEVKRLLIQSPFWVLNYQLWWKYLVFESGLLCAQLLGPNLLSALELSSSGVCVGGTTLKCWLLLCYFSLKMQMLAATTLCLYPKLTPCPSSSWGSMVMWGLVSKLQCRFCCSVLCDCRDNTFKGSLTSRAGAAISVALHCPSVCAELWKGCGGFLLPQAGSEVCTTNM